MARRRGVELISSPPIAVLSTTVSQTVGRFYGDIITTLQAQGYAVHVVTTDGPEVADLRQRCQAVHLVPMSRTISPVADLRALWQWLHLMRKLRPAFVLAGTPKASLLAMISNKLVSTPRRAYFLQGLRLEPTTGVQRCTLALMEWLTSWCSHTVIAVSPSLARRYRHLRLNAGRPVSIPHHGSSHGVDTVHFAPRARAENVLRDAGLDPTVPVLTFIGRVTRDKGIGTLIEAAHQLHAKGSQVQLVIAGDLDESDSPLQVTRLRESGLQVAIIGQLADVRPMLSVTDILVLPTWREGLPNVVLEAAAMEVPAITTDATGAVDSVVDGLTGSIVPVDDPSALASAVQHLLSDPLRRRTMGMNARVRVLADFQPRDVASAIIEAAGSSRRQVREVDVPTQRTAPADWVADVDLPATAQNEA